MTDALSPLGRKILAVLLLLVSLWLTASVAVWAVTARVGRFEEASELRDRLAALRSHRVDIDSLQARLHELTASEAFQHDVLVADTDRAALLNLQRSLRERIQSAHGSLLSISETSGSKSPSRLGVFVRARIVDAQLFNLVEKLEQGSPRLTIGDFSLISRPTDARSAADIDVTMTVNAIWSKPPGAKH